MTIIDVLVVGSGPTGLTTAAEALRLGLSVRVIDQQQQRDTNASKAPVLQSRTLELLNAMGSGRVTDRIDESGIKVTAWDIHVGQSRDVNTVKRLDLSSLPWGDTDYPYYLSLPQHNLEQILQEEIELFGGKIEWGKSVANITQNEEDDYVDSSVLLPDGTQQIIRSRWVVGCDGRHSKTREEAGIEVIKNHVEDGQKQKGINIHFEPPKGTFIIADFKTKNETLSRSVVSAFFHPEGTCCLLPLPEDKSFWFFAEAPTNFTSAAGDLEKNNVINKKFLNNLIFHRTGVKIDCYDLGWTTSFKVDYGVAGTYRKGRIFLAGDAAHYHSIAGGQGMNYGIQDAMNLVWKLAWAKRLEETGTSLEESILDSYQAERRPLAEHMMGSTLLSTLFLLSHNKVVQKIRDMTIPLILETSFEKEQMSRRSGMLNLQYSDDSPIILKHSPNPKCIPNPIPPRFLSLPGQRLPNIHTMEGKRVYNIIDRQRHSWLLVKRQKSNTKKCTHHFGPGGLGLLHAVVDDNSLGTPQTQALLVRPDLYVAAVDIDIDLAWDKFLDMLGPDAQASI